jgi:hypothetical protein
MLCLEVDAAVRLIRFGEFIAETALHLLLAARNDMRAEPLSPARSRSGTVDQHRDAHWQQVHQRISPFLKLLADDSGYFRHLPQQLAAHRQGKPASAEAVRPQYEGQKRLRT